MHVKVVLVLILLTNIYLSDFSEVRVYGNSVVLFIKGKVCIVLNIHAWLVTEITVTRSDLP